MTARQEAEVLLRRVGEDPKAELGLAHAALILATIGRPGVSLGRYLDHLSLIAADLGRAAAGAITLPERVAALNEIMYGAYGYEGDRRTYDDLQNANLMRVIDRRRGLPVALGIICIHAGRAQGWTIAGLRFPGHFLLRLEQGGQRAILDPFERGSERSAADLRALLRAQRGEDAELRPEHYEVASDREVLLRLQNNIKLRQVQRNDLAGAVATIETMLWIAPDDKDLWREKALFDAQDGHIDRAVAALEQYIARETLDGPRHEAAMLIQKLRGGAG